MVNTLKNLLVIVFFIFFVINVFGYNYDSVPTHNEVGKMIKDSLGGLGLFPADK